MLIQALRDSARGGEQVGSSLHGVKVSLKMPARPLNSVPDRHTLLTALIVWHVAGIDRFIVSLHKSCLYRLCTASASHTSCICVLQTPI